MKKRMDKGGQQSNWFLIVLVIAVIVLIVVALNFTNVFDKISDLFSQVSDLEVVAQACGVYASQGLATGYCYEFKEVKIVGKKQRANCEHLEGFAEFTSLDGGCNSTRVGDLAKQLCENEKLKKDDKVNEKTCEGWGVTFTS